MVGLLLQLMTYHEKSCHDEIKARPGPARVNSSCADLALDSCLES
jgi:hypothetical protein